MAEVLRLDGYDVTTAANGQQALDELADTETHPDLILLDMMMPGMDGWTFRRGQREDDGLDEIPVVVFTSAKDVDDDLDVAAALEKPVAIGHLLEVVGSQVEQ